MKIYCKLTIALCVFLAIVSLGVGPVAAAEDPTSGDAEDPTSEGARFDGEYTVEVGQNLNFYVGLPETGYDSIVVVYFPEGATMESGSFNWVPEKKGVYIGIYEIDETFRYYFIINVVAEMDVEADCDSAESNEEGAEMNVEADCDSAESNEEGCTQEVS